MESANRDESDGSDVEVGDGNWAASDGSDIEADASVQDLDTGHGVGATSSATVDPIDRAQDQDEDWFRDFLFADDPDDAYFHDGWSSESLHSRTTRDYEG